MLISNSKEKEWRISILNITVYTIILIKSLFFLFTIFHLILLSVDSHSFDDLHNFVNVVRETCEFLFRWSMSVFLIYLFNPFRTMSVHKGEPFTRETKVLVCAYGVMCLVYADYSTLFENFGP